MIGKLLSYGAKLRFALWMVEQAIPEPRRLKPLIDKGLLGVIIGVCSGVFFSAGLLMLILATYQTMVGMSLVFEPALWTLTSASLLLSILGFIIARRCLMQALDVSSAPRAPRQPKGLIEESWTSWSEGFFEGFVAKDARKVKTEKVKVETKVTTEETRVEVAESEAEKVVPIIRGTATPEEFIHRDPKTKSTY